MGYTDSALENVSSIQTDTDRYDFSVTFTPREIVSELDKYIIGQNDAKKAVAIALRNRWRRQRVESALQNEITPKNIIMIGSTGVGKTEIARRLAKLANAPFIKVEASKFTEVGYVGRDVDSMVRDLVENAVQLVTEDEMKKVKVKADKLAEEQLLDLLIPKASASKPAYEQNGTEQKPHHSDNNQDSRAKMKQMLRKGLLDDKEVEIPRTFKPASPMQVLSVSNMEDMSDQIQGMMDQMMGSKNKASATLKLKVPVALEKLKEEQGSKLLNKEAINEIALNKAAQNGIIFLDEIDKIAGGSAKQSSGPQISRQGVQRDILPIVEGTTVKTKYGFIKTDHILFIAAGAFHVSKVSDLIPELQGRFPIRVQLQSLTENDLLQIINEPKNNLPRQYTALMGTEGLVVEFTAKAKQLLAKTAARANEKLENIGARRLHTVFEALMSDISFNAPEMSSGDSKVIIDEIMVNDKLNHLIDDPDLSKYIL